MKKIILFTALIITNYVISQNDNVEIVIDFQDLEKSIKKEPLLNPVKFGSFHSFRMDGINRFLYEVTIEGKKVELETPIPTELQTLFRLNSSELAKTVDKNEVEETIENANDAQNEINELINAKSFGLEFQKNENLNKINSLLFNGNKKNKVQDSIQSVFLNLQINKTEDEIKKLQTFNEDVNSYILDIKTISNEILSLKTLRIELIILAQKDVSWKEMKNLVGQLGKPTKIKSSFNELSEKFEKLKTDYQDILKSSEQSQKGLIEASFKKLEDSFKTIDETSVLSLYSEVNFLFTELQNENNFRVLSPPTQADGDIVNYEVSITPSQTNALGPNRNPMTFDFDVPVKGGLKVDFSVGPVLSFGRGAKDEKFFLEDSETEGMSILRKRDNNNTINPGIGALMHFYKRSGTNTSFGGLFGVGAGFQSVDDVNLSFYTGVSLVMGKRQKIMLNTGISFLNVERLKENEFNIDSEYTTADFDINSVSEKVFKPSFFLSLTYNLTNRVER